MIHLFFDIDQTLVQSFSRFEYHSIPDEIRSRYEMYYSEFMDYYIFVRPGVEELFEELFNRPEQFELSIFTAGSLEYAYHVIYNVLIKTSETKQGKKKEFKYILTSQDFFSTIQLSHKGVLRGPKDLRYIGMSENDNYYLIDDTVENVASNPGKGILVDKFSIINPKDEVLKDLLSRLIKDT